MKTTLISVALFITFASCAPVTCGGGSATGKALYLITNDDQNSIAALPIGADGTLGQGTLTSTGGAGSVAVNAAGDPATPDALLSQSALKVAGNHIFAVNAGSNTLSMLSISSTDPTSLQLVGQPVAVPSEFPNTVTVSTANHLVCVGTTGAQAGIACSSFSHQGLSEMDGLRPFNLGQSTPPVGPTNTVSQTFFSEDGSMLFTTVKGDPAANKTGFVSMFPVESTGGPHGRRNVQAQVSMQGTTSSPAGTTVLFGSAIIPGTNNIFATDASFGAAVLSVDASTGSASVVGKGVIEGQKATCWTTISPATNTAFVSDVAVPRIVEMSLTDASVISEIDLSANGDPGFIDLAAAGGFVYALSPGNGTTEASVTVLDVSGGQGTAKMVQRLGLGGMGVGGRAQGLTVLL